MFLHTSNFRLNYFLFFNCLLKITKVANSAVAVDRLHLYRWVRYLPQRVFWYDTKQSDGEVPVMLERWGMRCTPSLPSLPGPLWPGVVAPNRVLLMSQTELCGLFDAKSIFFEEQQWYYLTYNWEDKRVHAFRNGISPKVNVKAQPEFELTYYDVTDQYLSHDTMGSSPQ